MYEVFDSFLNVPQWYTREAGERKRFSLCLAEVVQNSDFSPNKMGEHFLEHTESSSLTNEVRTKAIADYVADAQAVRYYLQRLES